MVRLIGATMPSETEAEKTTKSPGPTSILAEALNRARRWSGLTADLLDGTDISSTSAKQWIALTLQQLSLDHFNGMVHLCDGKLYGPAFALFRPQLEAHVRGRWLDEIATEEQLQSFLVEDKIPSMKKLIESLPMEGKFLLDFWKGSWSDLCDFTHGGSLHIRTRQCGPELAALYDEDYVSSLIQMSTALSYFSLRAVADSLSLEGHAEKIHVEFMAMMNS
jgi:hypothetical protein